MKYIFTLLYFSLFSFSFSFCQTESTQNWNSKLQDIIKDKNAKAVVFISSNDCISCISYVESGIKDMSVLYASDKNDFYDYCSEIGINIPQDRIIKDKSLINTLLDTFRISKLLLLKDNTIEAFSLNADAVKILQNDYSGTGLNSTFIPVSEDLDIDNFKDMIPVYCPGTKSYGILDSHYGFYHEFSLLSGYKKNFITINDTIQNYFYAKIAKALSLDSTIIYAQEHPDSIKVFDANFILAQMGQPKVSILNANDKYYLSYINYCTFDKPHDSSHVSITKATVLASRNGKEYAHFLKLFDKITEGSHTYYSRPYNVKISDKYIVVPYVNTDANGIPDKKSFISLGVFMLSDTGIHTKPNIFFKTNIQFDNYNNIFYDMIGNKIIVFDNLNKLIQLYNENNMSGSNGRSKDNTVISSYGDLNIKFVYDVNSGNNERGFLLLYNNNNNEAYLATSKISDNKINITENEKINKSFLNAASFNLSKINAYKIDLEKHGITFFYN